MNEANEDLTNEDTSLTNEDTSLTNRELVSLLNFLSGFKEHDHLVADRPALEARLKGLVLMIEHVDQLEELEELK